MGAVRRAGAKGTGKPWWIKERLNPQTGTYYTAEGQLSKTAAKRHERPLYGSSVMHSFETEKAYLERLKELRDAGERVY